ncbi:MAG: hypothetical protein IKZ43_06180 [Acidaminococcaceae bacterium]|nr:hypothetical protein [Acidaminococcaceae bacterium]
MKLMRLKSEKGQGLTEYVLILAFVAGVAFMMFGGNGSLKGTLANTFTKTVNILAGLFDDTPDWGKMDPETSFNDSNQAERYAHDQKMLENIANFFMDMEKKDVAKILNSVGDVTNTNDSPNILLGNIVRDENNGNVHFIVRSLKTNPTEEGYIGTMTINGGTYNYGYNDRIFNWMQGDYGPKDNSSYNLDYASSYNYMVSDYVLEQFKRDYNWNQKSFNEDSNGKEVGGNGIKVRLGYTDNDGKIVVDKVRVTIDNGSLNPNDKSTSAYSSSYSNGLEVTVKKGQDPQITNVGVGKPF